MGEIMLKAYRLGAANPLRPLVDVFDVLALPGSRSKTSMLGKPASLLGLLAVIAYECAAGMHSPSSSSSRLPDYGAVKPAASPPPSLCVGLFDALLTTTSWPSSTFFAVDSSNYILSFIVMLACPMIGLLVLSSISPNQLSFKFEDFGLLNQKYSRWL